jgi:TonB family protein
MLRKIEIIGLSPAAADELSARLPVRENDSFYPGKMREIFEAIRSYDEHLRPSLSGTPPDLMLRISPADSLPVARARLAAPPPPPPPPAADSNSQRIRVGGGVQQSKLISQRRPQYPPLAKQAKVQGVVQFQAVIAADGHVTNLQVISGHPLLVTAAMEAVRDWVYTPTLLNGNPVEVITQIDVNFTLSG